MKDFRLHKKLQGVQPNTTSGSKLGAFFISLIMAALDPIIEYSQRLGMEFGLKLAINEYKAWMSNKSIVLTKSQAEEEFTPDIITNLVRRGLLQDYQFGIEEVKDEDGCLIKKPKGRIYYRRIDILEAMEKGNLLKGMAELRASTHAMRENNDRARRKRNA